MNFKIYKTDLINKIMIFQLAWILFYGLAYSYYPSIAVFTYIPDILNIILIICSFERTKYGIKIRYLGIAMFVGYAFLSILWGDMNMYFIVASFRRYVTAMIIYFVSTEYITEKYLNKGINLFLFALGIDVFATGYQNLVLKLHPDFCNGIFGTYGYNNAMQGMFCSIISAIAMVYYIDKKWSKFKMIYALGTSCVICAFSEIKAFYILIITLFVIVLLFRCNNSKLRKKISSFIVIGVLLLYIAYKILERVFPENLATFFDLSHYMLYEKYGAHGGAGRLNSIQYIYNDVFKKNIFETLIGQGLGSVENEFAYTIGKLFVSFGVIGVMLLLGWVLYLFFKCMKKARESSENLIEAVILVMIVISSFLWNSLFTQMTYIIFWLLGINNINLSVMQAKGNGELK